MRLMTWKTPRCCCPGYVSKVTAPSGSRGVAVFGALCGSEASGPNFGPWPVSSARASTATATTTMAGTTTVAVRRPRQPFPAVRPRPDRRERGVP